MSIIVCNLQLERKDELTNPVTQCSSFIIDVRVSTIVVKIRNLFTVYIMAVSGVCDTSVEEVEVVFLMFIHGI